MIDIGGLLYLGLWGPVQEKAIGSYKIEAEFRPEL